MHKELEATAILIESLVTSLMATASLKKLNIEKTPATEQII